MWNASITPLVFALGVLALGRYPHKRRAQKSIARERSHAAIDKSTRTPSTVLQSPQQAKLFVCPISRVLLEEFLRHDAVDQLHAVHGLGHAEVHAHAGDRIGLRRRDA